MSNSKLTMIVILAALAGAASACSSAPAQTPPSTRAATQTPWIIYVPVTSTPEPATVTPLPTVTAAAPARTATKPPAPKPAATKAPPTVPPVATGPTTSPAPACNLGTVSEPFFPKNGDPRSGSGGSAIIFQWQPPSSLTNQGDSRNGYMIQVESRRSGGQHVNGITLYVSANKYLQDGRATLDQRAVAGLANGDNAVAIWNVTVVKTSGSFSDADPITPPPGLVNCGPPSQNMSVQLIVNQ